MNKFKKGDKVRLKRVSEGELSNWNSHNSFVRDYNDAYNSRNIYTIYCKNGNSGYFLRPYIGSKNWNIREELLEPYDGCDIEEYREA